MKRIGKPNNPCNPVTRVKKPEPSKDSPDWIIWAAWADRITFEEIYKVTGLTESKVIAHMRKSLKPSSFRLWALASVHPPKVSNTKNSFATAARKAQNIDWKFLDYFLLRSR